ncbi:MAG: PD40 domain-containing protein [Bacteroidia bacterium]|nr:PD40 domain-containing protein [Bacteroidia bacterium]
MNHRYFIIILLSFVYTLPGIAQYSYKQHIKYADKSYEQGNYVEAMIHYDKAYQIGEYLDEESIFRYGESALNTFSLGVAQTQFENYLDIDSTVYSHLASYNLARISHLQGNYAEAILNYNIYLSEYEDAEPDITRDVYFLTRQADWALKADSEDEIDTIYPSSGMINTPYSENAPFVMDDSIYYSSLRFSIPSDKLRRYRSRLFKNEKQITIEGAREENLLSNLSISDDGSFTIFSICDYDETYNIRCALYYGALDSIGNINGIKKLPEIINVDSTNTSQPNIRFNDPDYTLFFSSDRSGGKGQRDIWKSTFTKELEFTEPENISYINTEKDEVSPFFHENSEQLYFSSNGHNGFGGYDIYKIRYTETDSSSIRNLGNKINSPLNDVDPFVNTSSSEIYLASNRPGSKYLEDSYQTCCFDIFKAEIKDCEIDLIAEFYDSFDDTELAEVSVQILDKTNDEIVFNELVMGPEMEIQLDCDKEYELIALKRGYQDLNYPLEDLKPIYGQVNEVKRKIFMDPSDYNLSVEVFDEEETDLALTNTELTLMNLDTGEEKKLSNGESNLYNFEILPKTKYRIIANKRAYDQKIIDFNSGVGEPDVEKTIFLKKTEIVQVTKVSLKNAIPVQLYFDNDEPDPKTRGTYSSQNYTQTFYRYYDRKEKFKQVYSSRFSRNDKDGAVYQIEELFEDQIKAGFEKYEKFKNQLLVVLEAGQKVNIYLRGYASPVHEDDYNIALGKRRVDSIRKEFDEWRDGVFLPYLNSGQLIVTERSFGEETAPPGISDDPGNPNKSIFSPEASIERRVEIDEINFNEN